MTCCAPPRRRRRLVAWAAPGLVLAALPKCPACVAAYLAVIGIGLPVAAAAHLRTAIVIACIAALVVLVVRGAARVASAP